jgi:prepilin-type N-terminal cleavage/methylation domain-containing protein
MILAANNITNRHGMVKEESEMREQQNAYDDLKIPGIIALARNMRTFRRFHRLSQEEFAELCGLHRTYIGSIERGERNVTLQVLEILAQTMATSVAQLLVPIVFGKTGGNTGISLKNHPWRHDDSVTVEKLSSTSGGDVFLKRGASQGCKSCWLTSVEEPSVLWGGTFYLNIMPDEFEVEEPSALGGGASPKEASQRLPKSVIFREDLKAFRGFTLIELMVVILLIAVLAAIAVPNFRVMILKNDVSSGTSEIVSALMLARNEAVMRRTGVTLCTESGGMANGWKIKFGDDVCPPASTDTLLVEHEPLNRLKLCSTCSGASGSPVGSPVERFSFNSQGGLSGVSAGEHHAMVLIPEECPSGQPAVRLIEVSRLGHVSVQSETSTTPPEPLRCPAVP